MYKPTERELERGGPIFLGFPHPRGDSKRYQVSSAITATSSATSLDASHARPSKVMAWVQAMNELGNGHEISISVYIYIYTYNVYVYQIYIYIYVYHIYICMYII